MNINDINLSESKDIVESLNCGDSEAPFNFNMEKCDSFMLESDGTLSSQKLKALLNKNYKDLENKEPEEIKNAMWANR